MWQWEKGNGARICSVNMKNHNQTLFSLQLETKETNSHTAHVPSGLQYCLPVGLTSGIPEPQA